MPRTTRKHKPTIRPWKRCRCCEDFICTIHNQHVADCPCPPIDDWCAVDLYPYGDCDITKVDHLLAACKAIADIDSSLQDEPQDTEFNS